MDLPALRIVTGIPILHADGSVRDVPCYDEESLALYLPKTPLVLPAIPHVPTKAQALAALKALQEPYVNFPFRDQESRANHLAFLLTLLLRRALPCLPPAAVFNAPDRPDGTSLLVKTA